MNETVDDGAIRLNLKVLHFVVVEVLVKLFRQSESSFNQFIVALSRYPLNGIFQFAVAPAAPITLGGDGDNGVRGRAPQLFRGLQVISVRKLSVGRRQKLQGGSPMVGVIHATIVAR